MNFNKNIKKDKHDEHIDLLQLLLNARYEDNGTGMTDAQLRDEIITIFVAGHETTVNALSWTWYLLKQNNAEEQKLKEESLKFTSKREPSFEDLPDMNYGKQVINESMRLYPPVVGVSRKSIAESMIGNYIIPAGADIGVNIASIHRHPEFWQNPHEFEPQRFENFDIKGINRFTFMPFGAGPRICIGNNFAMMEMQLINAMLSNRVEMELVSKNIKPVTLFTLKPGNGVMVHLKKIKD
jgi:cytochrome P450